MVFKLKKSCARQRGYRDWKFEIGNWKLLTPAIILLVILCIAPPVQALIRQVAVPFVVQAPHANWQQPYQDACEEASIVMLDAFFDNDARKKMDAREADQKILELVRLERKVFGFDKDTDMAIMARIINTYYAFEARVVDDPSLNQIKQQIDAGNPVIVPIWGRDVTNPYFTPPGPTYHTVLVSGYDDDSSQFITQEPGTRNGRNFRYGYKELMNALADWLPDERGLPIQGGPPRALFVRKASLVKTAYNPKVYLIKNGERRHIVNEEIFLNSGFKWRDIRVVSEQHLRQYRQGLDLVEYLR